MVVAEDLPVLLKKGHCILAARRQAVWRIALARKADLGEDPMLDRIMLQTRPVAGPGTGTVDALWRKRCVSKDGKRRRQANSPSRLIIVGVRYLPGYRQQGPDVASPHNLEKPP
jgi:hypothetical protein